MGTHDVIIIGAGLSGLSAAHFILRENPRLRVILLEADDRAGGAVSSRSRDGYLAEMGPHGFLNNNAASQAILKDTGLDRRVQTAPLKEFERFICHRGRLVALPQSPPALFFSPLLSPGGKLRLFGDLFIGAREEDQTVAAWAARRFGRGVLPMVDVAVTGTFAGDMERLSIDAVMAGVRALEKKHGSLLRGLIKRGTMKGGSDCLPAMVNFPTGMHELVDTLARDRDIRFKAPVTEIRRDRDLWLVESSAGEFRAASLVVALPVNRALPLLAPLSAPPVDGIPVAEIVNVVMGVERKRLRLPKGFGYLAPEAEHRFALGAMFSSAMFPDRCPEDRVMIEVLVGGRRHPERVRMSDREIVAAVSGDVRDLLGMAGDADFVEVLRPRSGIPQLEMDHPALLAWRNDFEEETAGMHICGFGWDGIGMNEMMTAAEKVSRRLVAGRDDKEGARVKPVYF